MHVQHWDRVLLAIEVELELGFLPPNWGTYARAIDDEAGFETFDDYLSWLHQD